MASKTIGAAAAVAARRRGRPARSAQNVDTQRAAIVEAARTILVSAGLEAASARRIALAAGIAPATLYLYFENIEVLYAAVLGESLLQLQQYVRTATRDVPPPAKPGGDATLARARAAILAFFDFYMERPQDLSLGLHLYRGLGRKGLDRELDRKLNQDLNRVIALMRRLVARALACGPGGAAAMVDEAVSLAVGLLVVKHTGRDVALHTDARRIFTNYLDRVLPASG